MDEIQKILIKLGHKDLAQKYYEKVAVLNKQEVQKYIDFLSEEITSAVLEMLKKNIVRDIKRTIQTEFHKRLSDQDVEKILKHPDFPGGYPLESAYDDDDDGGRHGD